jgi:type 1 glutamine amidotransferase
MQKILISFLALFSFLASYAQSLETIEINENWLASVEKSAPSTTRIVTKSKKKILVFSKATGFDHWTIPHNVAMLKILAKKSAAFEIHIGYDIENFDKKNLKKYDAIILNNSNPSGPDRDLFTDLLKQNTTLTDQEIRIKAANYEHNLIRYVSKGGGLMILHGAITVQNNSVAFSKMTGGSFDYHPKQQEIHVKEVDVNHPMVKAFNGKGLTHIDEPYFFKNAYFDYNYRPLLYMEVDKLKDLEKEVKEKVIYVSWIKRHGKGRVFFSSPGHNAQSMENPELLQYYLDGMQYIVSDLKCDDFPIVK